MFYVKHSSSFMKLKEKEAAIRLRKRGYSINEIYKELGVSKSSVSLWTREIPLSQRARHRLERNLTRGQLRSREVLHARGEQRRKYARQIAQEIMSSFTATKAINQILCAMMYYCEGTKADHVGISFTNSSPFLVKTFLELLRDSFDLQETKFSVCLHLHAYHNEKRQKKFWSDTTNIPETQFMKSFRKKNTEKRIRENYPGCVNIRYYDVQLCRILNALALEYMKHTGPSVNR